MMWDSGAGVRRPFKRLDEFQKTEHTVQSVAQWSSQRIQKEGAEVEGTGSERHGNRLYWNMGFGFLFFGPRRIRFDFQTPTLQNN